ncbi:MAG: pilin [Candidatus Paceibacterota bacterium]
MKSQQKKLNNKKTLYLFSVVLFLGLSLIISVALSAGVGQTPGVTLPNPLGADNITDILKNIVNYLIKIGAPILAIMILIGGFQILTAGDNPEKVKTGRHTILYSVIGYAIILSAWGIVAIIEKLLE